MIKQAIDKDLKTAMLAGDKPLVSVLRGLKSAVLYAEVAGGARDEGLSDEGVLSVLQKESKKRSDAIELYEKIGEQDRAVQERYEQGIIAKYLPSQLSEDEIRKVIDEVIQGLTDKPSMQSMGLVIGAVKQKTKGTADGAVIARLVRENLAS